ncbi:uncharacterized protein LOC128386536 [Panonychus citri]|uniref:uncharacterized protein LOC128386536 n=1 Tax=Panonychus citri TaxID=50023 RepID=UPI002307E677|nr:uncharacterized protein LOC128386536 [Panonychus citri]
MNSSYKLSTVCWLNLINLTLCLYLIASISLVDCSSLRWLPTSSDLTFQSNGDDRGSGYNLDPVTKEWIQWRNMLNELEKQRQSNLDSIPTNDKRGLDLGLRRGLSGQRAAKHLVGLANAEFAGGPGKKR